MPMTKMRKGDILGKVPMRDGFFDMRIKPGFVPAIERVDGCVLGWFVRRLTGNDDSVGGTENNGLQIMWRSWEPLIIPPYVP